MSLFAMYFKQLHFPHSCLRAVEWSYLCRRSEGVPRSAKLLTVWVYYIRDTKHFFAGNHRKTHLIMSSWRISFSRSICSCYDSLHPPPRKLHLRIGDREITVYSRDDSFREILEPLAHAIGRGLSDAGNGKPIKVLLWGFYSTLALALLFLYQWCDFPDLLDFRVNDVFGVWC